ACEGDREQAQGDGSAAEQECCVHGACDEQCGVDGRFQPDGDAGEDHGRRTGLGAFSDVLDGSFVGLGEVAGEQLDGGCQNEADEYRGDGDEPWIGVGARFVDLGEDGVTDPGELFEVPRQVPEGGDHDQDRGDSCGDEEPAINRGHRRAVLFPGGDEEDADDCGDDTDHRYEQGEDEAFDTEGDP